VSTGAGNHSRSRRSGLAPPPSERIGSGVLSDAKTLLPVAVATALVAGFVTFGSGTEIAGARIAQERVLVHIDPCTDREEGHPGKGARTVSGSRRRSDATTSLSTIHRQSGPSCLRGAADCISRRIILDGGPAGVAPRPRGPECGHLFLHRLPCQGGEVVLSISDDTLTARFQARLHSDHVLPPGERRLGEFHISGCDPQYPTLFYRTGFPINGAARIFGRLRHAPASRTDQNVSTCRWL